MQVEEDPSITEQIDWWENYCRLPGDLVPEYRVWWWRTVGHWWHRARLTLWWSKPIQSIIHGWWYSKRQKRHITQPWGFLQSHLAQSLYDWLGWGKWVTLEWNYCPECGFKYDFTATMDSDWFRFTEGGKSFNGDYTEIWFRGEWTCPRCLRQWEYGDSN